MIHYHGLPITGEGDPIMAMSGRHCMVSFAHPGQVAEAAELCQSFVLDNGAFSKWKGGSELSIGELADWVSRWAIHPSCDWYCIPDVIDGGADANAQMRAKWFNSVGSRVWDRGIPIWHLDEPLEVLRDFMGWPQSTIAIGSAGEYSEIGTKNWWSRIAEAMSVLCDENGFPKKKIHGLRMLDPTIFSHIPLTSADSTNVARNCGLDTRWNGPYAPRSRKMRALIMMDRIEVHASASRWNFETAGIQKNLELFG